MKKILVIEDEKSLSEVISTKLKNENYEVFCAYDGEEGLSMIQKILPDLVLLDIVLPVMNGITLIEKVKADDAVKNIPIIILSNLADAQKVIDCKEKGITDYLIKTEWSLEDVLNKIKLRLDNP